MFPKSSQHNHVQPSFDINQSVNSHVHISEVPEVTSAPNIQNEVELLFHEDGFLEIDDLIDTEPTLSKMENPLENLQFEDGLSEFDLYQDAEMFLHDLEPITRETVSNAYMNNVCSNVENQNYQLLPNPEDVDQIVDEFWMHDEINILSPAEGYSGSFSLTNPGIVTSTRYSVTQLPNNNFAFFDLDGDASFPSHFC